MSFKLGPILGFRGNDKDQWKVSVLVVTEVKPSLDWKSNGASDIVECRKLKEHGSLNVWIFEWQIAQKDAAQEISYSFGDKESWSFYVPPKRKKQADGQEHRLRMAYASCNGFSSPSAMKKVMDQNERWKSLLEQHKRDPFHLLLMGGDQVYADSLWEEPLIKKWVETRKPVRINAPFTPEMKTEVENFYFQLYCKRWSQPDVKDTFARIPSLMMWDDHDIFDGWGSYDEKMQNCKVYQGIFEQAKEYFRVFQIRKDAAENFLTPKGFSFVHKIGDVAIIVPDLRSERTMDQVMSRESWDLIIDWMDNLSDVSQLFVVSSIPVVYPGFSAVETILGILPGRQEVEDDLKDHWTSASHRGERLRLIHRLLKFSAEQKCRVTILSGDVHVGALGQIDSRLYNKSTVSDSIHQLISSGIVHPTAPGLVLCFLKNAADKVENVDTGISAYMTEFPGSSAKFIGARNWLSLTVDETRRVWAEWFAEDEAKQKLIEEKELETGKVSKMPQDPEKALYTKVIQKNVPANDELIAALRKEIAASLTKNKKKK